MTDPVLQSDSIEAVTSDTGVSFKNAITVNMKLGDSLAPHFVFNASIHETAAASVDLNIDSPAPVSGRLCVVRGDIIHD